MNSRSSFLLGASLCASLSLALACAAPPPTELDAVPQYDTGPTYPHWAGKPVTWSKLADIEEWQAGAGPREYPDFVQTAELELAEGRLALALQEGKGLPPQVLAGRLRTAESGFRELLASSDLRPALRQRAERGLADVEARAGGDPRGAPKVARKATGPTPPAQAVHGGLTIQPRTAWKAAPPLPHRLTGAREGWNRITVHHSAKDTKDIGAPTSGNVADAIKDIQSFHMRERGWGDIGYHFLIDPSGRIWQGRLLDWQGAHAQGANNVSNIGICLFGDFNHERPDPRALESLERLVDALCERHEIARGRVYGHQKFAATECPGDSLMAWIARYAAGATD